MTRVLALCLALLFVPAAAWGNPAHERLKKLSEGERSAFFQLYLQRAGEVCGRVTRTFYQGATKGGDAFWNVACTSGKAFSIMVKNDATGSSSFTDCAILKAVHASTCFKKF
jgi:hypothetical protein